MDIENEPFPYADIDGVQSYCYQGRIQNGTYLLVKRVQSDFDPFHMAHEPVIEMIKQITTSPAAKCRESKNIYNAFSSHPKSPLYKETATLHHLYGRTSALAFNDECHVS